MSYTSKWHTAGARRPGKTYEILTAAVAQAYFGASVSLVVDSRSLESLARRLKDQLEDTGLGRSSGGRGFEIGAGSIKLVTPDELAG